MNTEDQIQIQGLEIWCHIGVPDDERASPQKLLVDVVLVPETDFENAHDSIENTVDYAGVCSTLREIASSIPRKLIETLAADCAREVLLRYPVRKARIRVRKFILPETEHVAVVCERTKS